MNAYDGDKPGVKSMAISFNELRLIENLSMLKVESSYIQVTGSSSRTTMQIGKTTFEICNNKRRAICGYVYATIGWVILFLVLIVEIYGWYLYYNPCLLVNHLDMQSQSWIE